MRLQAFFVVLIFSFHQVLAAEEELQLPADLSTIDDGRAPIRQLFSSYGSLLERGWKLDVVAYSHPGNTRHDIPIIALRSALSGPAIWIISGIHGEEPAGPNAIAAVIDEIAALGERRPVVLIPLSNPHGYARNWRYLNAAIWAEDIDAQSVGDSSHMLPDADHPGQARADAASSAEAAAMTRYVVDKLAEYPPLISIDLHEDDKIPAGYVYSQGVRGASEPLAAEAVRILRENAIPIKLNGKTRFDEEIVSGIIGPVTDSSIDELMSATEIIVDGRPQAGPAADTVLVFETPAANLPLARRIRAHEALLRRIIRLLAEADN